MCVCVCLSVRERERRSQRQLEIERGKGEDIKKMTSGEVIRNRRIENKMNREDGEDSKRDMRGRTGHQGRN